MNREGASGVGDFLMFNVVTTVAGRAKRIAVSTGCGLAVLGFAGAAAASPGCDAINAIWGGGVTLSNGLELYEPWPLPPMKAGDEVVYVASTTGSTNTHIPNGGGFALYKNQGVAWPDDILIEEYGSQGAELSVNGRYVLTDDNVGFIVYGWSGSGDATLRATVTCTAAAAAPTVTSLSPDTGPADGGGSIVITGTDFTGATAVRFGAMDASSFTVNSATRITAIAPANPGGGAVPVTVTTALGSSSASGASTYTYVQRPAAPTITSAPPLITNATTASFVFVLPDGASALVSLDGATFQPATSPLTLTGLGNGAHAFTVKSVLSGFESEVAAHVWTVDTVIPPPPVVTPLAPGANRRPTFQGVTEPNSTVTVLIDGVLSGVTNSDASGNWSFSTPGDLMDGPHMVQATATDLAGNVSPPSPPVPFMTAAAPVASNLSVPIAYGATSVPIDLSASITGVHTGIVLGTAPTHGAASVSGDVVTYTPAVGYFGPDSFTYTASGPGGTSAAATVSLVVAAPGAPVAADVSGVAVAYDSAGQAIDLSASITGVHTSIAIGRAPAHGATSIAGDVVTYRPTAGYSGADSFTYTATGHGGTSAAATVNLTVAAPTAPEIDPPAPVVVQPTPGGSATVDLPPVTSGTVTGYRVEDQPSHGQVAIQAPGAGAAGWSVAYTPAPGFMGEDTIRVVAQGPGGDSAPATMTFRVLGAAPDLQGTTLDGQTLAFEPTASLTGGPFQGLAITRQPISGTARVDGLRIIYTPAASAGAAVGRMATRSASVAPAAGPVSMEYTVILPFGASLPGTIEIEAAATTPTLTPLTATTLAGRPVTVSLTDTATGGPFVGATIVSVSDDAGTATLSEGGVAGNRTYDLTFTPGGDFTGLANITYSLSNAGGAATGVLAITVEARPDPSLDPEVRGLVSAQADTARRFARSQADNFHRRLEQVRRGGVAGVSNQMRMNLGDGGLNQDPREALRQQLGQSPGDRADRVSTLAAVHARAVDETPAANAPVASAPAGKVGVWTAGAIDWGRRDAQGQRDYRFSTSGVSAGVDMAISDRLIAGVGVGYGHDRTRVGDNGTLSEGDSYVGALYGSWRATGDLVVDGVLGYGALEFDSRRWSSDADDFAFGERSGSVLFGSASIALERRSAGLAWAPYARLQFGKVELDGYAETGADVFALTYDAMTVDTLATALGTSFDWTLQRRSGVLAPSLRVEWRHEFEGADDQAVSYADWLTSPDYLVGLERWARDSVSLGAGVQWRAVSGWTYGVDYQGQLGSDLSSHGLRLRLMKLF